MKIYDYGYTHAGVFHADDVFATALLRIINPEFNVERVNKVPNDVGNAIVYDIGGGKFDHHQPGAPVRANGVQYAAFGLLWKEYGFHILGNVDDVLDFDKNFAQEIDYVDNTGNRTLFTKTINDFNADPCNKEEQDIAFEEAVEFAMIILRNRFKAINQNRADMDECARLMSECDGQILVMENKCLSCWKRLCTLSSYIFVVYKSPRNCWNVQGVPDHPGSSATKLPFPEDWRGLNDQDLVNVSGIEGMEFCHKGGYLCAVDSKETAIHVAETMINSIV